MILHTAITNDAARLDPKTEVFEPSITQLLLDAWIFIDIRLVGEAQVAAISTSGQN